MYLKWFGIIYGKVYHGVASLKCMVCDITKCVSRWFECVLRWFWVVLKWFRVVWCVFGWFEMFPHSRFGRTTNFHYSNE